MTQLHTYKGLIPSPSDPRDTLYAFEPPCKTPSPEMDWRDCAGAVPPVKNQFKSQSCTGFSTSNAFQFLQLAQDPRHSFTCSAFFPYYNARVTEGTEAQDCGAQIRDVFSCLNKQGICSETLWPSINPDVVSVTPSLKAYSEGQFNQLLEYNAVEQNLDHMKAVIAARRPLCFGIKVYESFESTETLTTGRVTMPRMGFLGFGREKFLGRHAIWSFGYSDAKQEFLCMNSWGTEENDDGILHIPYEFMCEPDLTSEIFTMTLAEEGL